MLAIDLLDDEVAIGMQVHASNGNFAGTGLAYFTAFQIHQFGSDLERMAVNPQIVAHIERVLYENDKLTLPRVQISCKCLGAGMRVRMLVRLAQDPYTDCLLEEVMQLTLPLEFERHNVERAGVGLQSLPNLVEISCECILIMARLESKFTFAANRTGEILTTGWSEHVVRVIGTC